MGLPVPETSFEKLGPMHKLEAGFFEKVVPPINWCLHANLATLTQELCRGFAL